MGWATGTNAAGRDIGYGVEATCDHPTCSTEIDRGLAYVCGGIHDGDEHGCGKYFCDEHLGYRVVVGDDREPKLAAPQLCDACIEAYSDDEDGE